MQSWLTHLFANFKGFFASPKVKAAEAEVVTLMPAAMGIVSEIDALAPNKTLDEFNTIATKYALPTITALGAGQTPGNVALNLGSAILAKNHAPACSHSPAEYRDPERSFPPEGFAYGRRSRSLTVAMIAAP